MDQKRKTRGQRRNQVPWALAPREDIFLPSLYAFYVYMNIYDTVFCVKITSYITSTFYLCI